MRFFKVLKDFLSFLKFDQSYDILSKFWEILYEYIARNCYNVVFSTYLKIKCRGKTSIAVLYISGLLLHLELKIKKQFLNYQNT